MTDLETPCPPAPAGFGPENGPEFAAGAMATSVAAAPEATAGRCGHVDQPSYLAAIEGLAAVEASATAIAAIFRRGDSEAACTKLLEWLRGVHSLSLLLDLFARARGVDLDTMIYGHQLSAIATVQTVAVALGALLEAQSAQDWVTTADTLQYELAPALHTWRPLIDSLCGRSAS